MARRNDLTCDRCGKVLRGRGGMDWYAKEISARITLWPVGAHRSNSGQRIDLCISCAEAFNRFLENKDGDNDE